MIPSTVCFKDTKYTYEVVTITTNYIVTHSICHLCDELYWLPNNQPTGNSHFLAEWLWHIKHMASINFYNPCQLTCKNVQFTEQLIRTDFFLSASGFRHCKGVIFRTEFSISFCWLVCTSHGFPKQLHLNKNSVDFKQKECCLPCLRTQSNHFNNQISPDSLQMSLN